MKKTTTSQAALASQNDLRGAVAESDRALTSPACLPGFPRSGGSNSAKITGMLSSGKVGVAEAVDQIFIKNRPAILFASLAPQKQNMYKSVKYPGMFRADQN